MSFYEGIVLPRAEREIEDAYRWLVKHAPSVADEWMDGLLAAVDTLEEMPARCPLAPEAQFFKEEVRHLLYDAYRLIFVIDERHVRILSVRHASRQPMKRRPRT